MTFDPLRSVHSTAYPFIVIAGPCSAETEDQVMEAARALKRHHIDIFRASLWKPRTKPGGFEGVGSKGIPWLLRVRDELGMKVATEVATRAHVEEIIRANIDIIWIGARTTSSPFAMAEIADALRGYHNITVFIKNPINPDIELWIGAIERLREAGINKIGAIHRGFSTYGQSVYRNPPHWQIPIELKRRYPTLTLIGDPSHITGKRELVAEVCQTSLDMHYDGLIVESHCHPAEAQSDSRQQITPDELGDILTQLKVHKRGDDNSFLLEAWRKQIDQIDEQLIELLSDRMVLSKMIGDFKANHNLCIVQPPRYKDMLEKRIAKGGTTGLDASFIKDIFSTIHEQSVLIQQSKKK